MSYEIYIENDFQPLRILTCKSVHGDSLCNILALTTFRHAFLKIFMEALSLCAGMAPSGTPHLRDILWPAM